jgi:hypothetical protein
MLYSQWGPNSPSIEFIGKIDSNELWEENCYHWERTIRGMTGQIPAHQIRICVQYLLEYVRAYGQISKMKIEVNDVWVMDYSNYIVFVWFTGYNEGSWTYKSMNILTY